MTESAATLQTIHHTNGVSYEIDALSDDAKGMLQIFSKLFKSIVSFLDPISNQLLSPVLIVLTLSK